MRIREGDESFGMETTYSWVVRPESKGKVARTIEKGHVTTRGIVVVELDAAIAHSFVVAGIASSRKDRKVVAVKVDLYGVAAVSTCLRPDVTNQQLCRYR